MAATVSRTFGGVVPEARPRARQLVHHSIGQRIAKGNAQFEHVHAGLIERQRQLPRHFKIRIPAPI
jgi:hypothetical protein